MAYLGPSLRREKRTERPVRRAALAAIVSLALNALLLQGLVAAGAFHLPGPTEKTRVALAPLSASQWDANRAVARGPAAPVPQAQAKPQPPAPPEEPSKGRVVELNPDQKTADRPPDDAKFLAERNTHTDKETVSKDAGNSLRVAPRPEPGAEGKPQPQPPPQKQARRDVEPGGKDAGKPGREGASGDRLALARPGAGLRLPELGEGGQGGRRGEAGPDLSVSPEAMARIAGGPNMDGVREGLPEGEQTFLNAREFKYATFMNRFRTQVAEQWYPRVQEAQRQRDPDGSHYFYKERTVVIGITMDTEGHVKDMSVLQSSNVDFFDRVALASVKAADPFPNPPSGMFHGEGQIQFPFGFTLYPGDRRLIFWRPPTGN